MSLRHTVVIRRAHRTSSPESQRPIVHFAFAGRCSAEDRQDPETSRHWQLTGVRALIEPAGGKIVTEHFDAGPLPRPPLETRPQATALLQVIRHPQRGFDAIVICEPQRTFHGNQFGTTFPFFVHFGVPLWIPEVGGAIDPDNEAHDLVISVFGGMSNGERNPIKIRVCTAMASQAQIEGRYLCGRPPTATDSPTRAHTPTRPRPPTANASTASNPTPQQPRRRPHLHRIPPRQGPSTPSPKA